MCGIDMDTNEFAEFIASIADTTKDSGKLNAAYRDWEN